jgi:hypothetical protein
VNKILIRTNANRASFVPQLGCSSTWPIPEIT